MAKTEGCSVSQIAEWGNNRSGTPLVRSTWRRPQRIQNQKTIGREKIMKHSLIAHKQHVVCIKNKGYEASLERRKIYRVLPDKYSVERGLLRIVDESGQAYLYPNNFFAHIRLPPPLAKALALAA